MGSELRRLSRVEIDGLFGLYDHRIGLSATDRVTLLHGSNGVGKTTTLRMVDALLRRDLGYFSKLPFRRFLLEFHGDCAVEIRKRPGSNSDVGELSLTGSGPSRNAELALRSTEDAGAHGEGFYSLMETLWRQGIRTAIEQSDEIPDAQEPSRSATDADDLSWFDEFRGTTSVLMVPAQRLVTPFAAPADGLPAGRLGHRVLACASDLKKRLDATMADYGREAQALDQTFPRRLVSAKDGLDLAALEQRLASLADQEAHYQLIGLLDRMPEHPLETTRLEHIDSTEAKVMTLYVEDTEKKLQGLEDFASRVGFLLKSINEKYSHKRIRLDQDQGLVAERDDGHPIPLESLSSGEQHELVLYSELLFKTRPNTVVLIDEPELSLHVTWQKQFLADLLDIVRMSHVDALIATHSPYIAGYRDDLLVRLGDPLPWTSQYVGSRTNPTGRSTSMGFLPRRNRKWTARSCCPSM